MADHNNYHVLPHAHEESADDTRPRKPSVGGVEVVARVRVCHIVSHILVASLERMDARGFLYMSNCPLNIRPDITRVDPSIVFSSSFSAHSLFVFKLHAAVSMS
jgi:hypothetical protein